MADLQLAELAPAYVVLASGESRDIVGEVLGVTGGKPLGRGAAGKTQP